MKPALRLITQFGLGDCIYHRPFVKQLAQTHDLYLETSWPELYSDLDVKFVRPVTTLRTQNKNINRQQVYTTAPQCTPYKRVSYAPAELSVGLSMLASLAKAYGLPTMPLDLPYYESPLHLDKPYIVVRPATIRREWNAASRNPDPTYIYRFIELARQDYTVISVADLSGTDEYALTPLPYADITLHAGELDVTQLIGLIQGAAFVVGGVGFIVPMCLATKTPLFCILGGNGAYNRPEVVMDDSSLITFAKPDRFCMCNNARHNCDKRIKNFDNIARGYLENRTVIC